MDDASIELGPVYGRRALRTDADDGAQLEDPRTHRRVGRVRAPPWRSARAPGSVLDVLGRGFTLLAGRERAGLEGSQPPQLPDALGLPDRSGIAWLADGDPRRRGEASLPAPFALQLCWCRARAAGRRGRLAFGGRLRSTRLTGTGRRRCWCGCSTRERRPPLPARPGP